MIPIYFAVRRKRELSYVLGEINRSLLLLGIILILSSVSSAQVDTASVSGVITDQSGGIVIGAEVHVTNSDTNITSTGISNQSGVFLVTGLRPGRYRIRVEKEGFKGIDLTDLILNVQDAINRNFTLQVGSTSQTVSVEASGLAINTQDATVSTVVDRNFVENIPLNGRSFQTLIALTPGVVLSQASSNEPGQFSVNGQRADANYFSVDGVSANIGTTYGSLGQFAAGAQPGLSALGGTNSLVSVDAMQEFRVQTSSFAPEFGRTPGGQISIVTRSGSNEFHGTAFDYLRNDVFDANNWFANANHLPKPEERQNDFGGVLGGPIIKNKTFFFFSYEGLRLRQPLTTESIVPNSDPADPQSRQFAPAAMQPFLNAFPIPNGPSVGGGLAEFNSSYSNPASLNAYSIRIDHNLSSKLSLFGRYNYAPSQTSARATSNLNGESLISQDMQTFTVGLTAALSPKVSNELRLNYSNARIRQTSSLGTFGGAVAPPDSVLFPTGYSSENAYSIFYDALLNGGPLFVVGTLGRGEQRQVNLVENASVSIRTHQLKFGIDYRWLAPFNSPPAYSQLALFYTTSDVFSGTANYVQVLANQGNALLSQDLSLYAQDTWRATPRFAVTYGVRWDVNPAISGKNATNDPFGVIGLSNPSTMTLAPRGSPLYETTYGNLAPRLGLAYQIEQKPDWVTVLRAGGGIFYDLGSGSLGNVTGGFPYTAVKAIIAAPFPLTPQQAVPPAFSLNPSGATLYVSDPNLKLPRTYQWNVAVQQSLGATQTLTLSYIGAAGRDLLRQYLIYPGLLSSPNPTFGGSGTINVVTNGGTSDYDALQVQFQRRVARGLQALASYTFGHAIDNASVDSSAFSAPGVTNQLDRGNSNFDVRHSVSAALTYSIPNVHGDKTARAILGDWSLDTFLTARSATPVDLAGGASIVQGTFLTSRPDVVLGQPLYLTGSKYPGGKAINPNAFTPASAGQQGTLGRNALRGFGMWQSDFAVRRQFHLAENLSLQFRAEFFNIFNHPNFASPVSSLFAPQFGLSTQTLGQSLGTGGANGGLSSLYQIGGPRSIQFALKLQF
jgi:hypothetical protein